MLPGVSLPEVKKVPNDVEEVGDIVRPLSSENDRYWMEGAGILLDVFGHTRGDAISSLREYSVVSVLGVVLGEGAHIWHRRMSGHVREVL